MDFISNRSPKGKAKKVTLIDHTMLLLEHGLTTTDIDQMDVRTFNYLVYHLSAKEEIKRLQFCLDVADAVRMASASLQAKENISIYKRWRNRLNDNITELETGEKPKKETIWNQLEKLPKKKGKILIN